MDPSTETNVFTHCAIIRFHGDFSKMGEPFIRRYPSLKNIVLGFITPGITSKSSKIFYKIIKTHGLEVSLDLNIDEQVQHLGEMKRLDVNAPQQHIFAYTKTDSGCMVEIEIVTHAEFPMHCPSAFQLPDFRVEHGLLREHSEMHIPSMPETIFAEEIHVALDLKSPERPNAKVLFLIEPDNAYTLDITFT